MTTRRRFLAAGAGGIGALAFGPAFWRTALAQDAAVVATGPYGPLQAADGNGLRLPAGFTSRIVARSMQPVGASAYPWHPYPDGAATFPLPGGRWALAVNSESLAAVGAGSSAIRFAPDGSIEDAYRILGGTNANCAGGPTPWGTWLSCEEYDGGHVFECDPAAPGTGTIRPALGTFCHEAACVDPVGKRVYLTEDKTDGGLYRFTPASYPDLSQGSLEVAVAAGGALEWAAVPDPSGISAPTRTQVPGMKRFVGGEGLWFDSGVVYFTTKGDNRVWEYDTATRALTVIYDAAAVGPDAPLHGVDNITVNRGGEIFVCEDGGNMEICLITAEREVSPFLRLEGAAAAGPPDRGNELAGVTFSPAGDRMYFSAQRAFDYGVTYEVRGPFAAAAASPTPTATASPTPAATATPSASPSTVPGAGQGQLGASSTGRRRRLSVRAARRVDVERLSGWGYDVEVRSPVAGRAIIALRTPELARVPGQRGSVDRPRPVTLARTADRVDRGRNLLWLEAGPRMAARLRRRRSTRARLTVLVRGVDGSTSVVARDVRVLRRRSGR